ncbi:MAG: AmmeMemoRadiSam system radical SAM enzyme [Epsilonproteobacteria bacterium]|nr:MAG: AmmeMemoRadiSam system radical SAM enzyme [Campylobacterota bacterium]
MKFYKQNSTDTKKITCLLCGHYCNIKEGNVGICKVNKNTGDKIECLVYGYPNAMNIDPIEKKPLYHFLPNTKTFSIGTVGCNFKCSFCQNWQLSQSHNIDKSQYYSPEDIVKLALHYKCESISYTYNEPTIFFPYIIDIAILAHKNGLKNIMVTNGFESKEVSQQMVGLIDAVNVDLKSFDDKYYKKNLGGKLDVVLENLKYYVTNGIHTEITTLIVPTHNDNMEEIIQIVSFIANELGTDIPWHISAFHPDYKELELPRTPLDSLKKAEQIGKDYGLKYIYLGNTGGLV